MTVRFDVDPLQIAYPTTVRPDLYDDGSMAYIAEIPDLPGCKAHGATTEEALAALDDAKREYISALVEAGLPVPPPSADQIGMTWTVVRYSEPQLRSSSEAPSFTALELAS
jgi:antitoxin HicB